MRSMFSGVSGLRAHQTKMDVIAHNIANVNTVGFKSSRATFSEYFSQSVSGATAANEKTGRGGINPMQIGLGSSVASIDVNMSTGASQRTDKPLDLMIEGESFFIVNDGQSNYFTRAGAFNLDAMGNLVDPNGYIVQGWDAEEDPNKPGTYKVNQGTVEDVKITGDDLYSPPSPTTAVEFNGNLNAIEKPIFNTTVAFKDSLGNEWMVDAQYEYDEAADTWNYKLGNYAYTNNDRTKGYELTITAPTAGTVGDPPTNGTPGGIEIGAIVDPLKETTYTTVSTVDFNNDGVVDYSDAEDADSATTTFTNYNETTGEYSLEFNITGTDLPVDATFGNAGIVGFDFGNITQFSSDANATSKALDGNEAGALNSISVSEDGVVSVTYTNGDIRAVKQIAVAQFDNPAGLEKIGSNLFQATANSGAFDGIGVSVAASGGSISSGVLEMSNVDLAQEFTEMITTQRGYQANSRVITTSDEILQELVNLKR